MTTCKLCQKDTDNAVDGICDVCRSDLGIVSLPPPRRPPTPCTRCQSTRFIRVFPRERLIVDATSLFWGASLGAISERFVPMVATHELTYIDTPAIGMEPAQHKPRIDLRKPRGLFARYICSGCGAVELVCEEPEAIPIGPEHMTDVVDVAAAGSQRQ